MRQKLKFAFYDFTGHLTSKHLDLPANADEVTLNKGGSFEAEVEARPEKQSLVVTTENNAKDHPASNDSSSLHLTKTPTGSDDITASKGSSFKNVATLSSDLGNATSDMYKDQKNESKAKHLPSGERGQINESRKVARCKLPFEKSTIF